VAEMLQELALKTAEKVAEESAPVENVPEQALDTEKTSSEVRPPLAEDSSVEC